MEHVGGRHAMKILVNRKIKRLFLCILLAVSAFALASAPALCLGTGGRPFGLRWPPRR